MFNLRFEAFIVVKCIEAFFLGNKLLQYGINFQCFGDCLCLIISGW